MQTRVAPSQGDDISPEMVADRGRSDMIRAAWLYFIEQRTQSEIAAAMGMTRFRVNRMLADCRSEGLVRVEIDHPLAPCKALEAEAVRAFGLSAAVVVPTPLQATSTNAMIGAGLAGYMAGQLEDAATKVIGVGWGTTMREMLRHLAPVDRPDLQIVTLLGALHRASEENSIEIIALMGALTGGSRCYMTAPVFADTPEARYVLTAQPFYEDVRRLILSADTACFAVGDMSAGSLLVQHALPSGITGDDLVQAGAVGDLLGTFIDADGRPLDHRVNRQLVGPSLDDLRQVGSLVLASGGVSKRAVIAAALKNGLIDVLVTDEATVAAILAAESAGGPPSSTLVGHA